RASRWRYLTAVAAGIDERNTASSAVATVAGFELKGSAEPWEYSERCSGLCSAHTCRVRAVAFTPTTLRPHKPGSETRASGVIPRRSTLDEGAGTRLDVGNIMRMVETLSGRR